MSKVVVVTPPSIEPVTLAEQKHQSYVYHDEDNSLLTSYIKAAREYVEGATGKTCINTTFDMFLDEFPCEIVMPRNPLVSVTSIKYFDLSNAEQTLASNEYDVDGKGIVGRITPAYSKAWPSTYDKPNAVVVRFVAGHGTTAADVPELLKLSVKELAAAKYENREPFITGSIVAKLPFSLEAALKLAGIPKI